MELWKPVKGYEKYYTVSSTGKIYSIKMKRELKGSLIKGYRRVKLKGISFAVHRLVADAFIKGRCEYRRCVNHKDCDRLNNHMDNLEWCSHLENSEHAVKMGRYKRK
tara:strand:+ start:894 stop:1214 length:321 start_codon:yes stop_codon:yes gene_type:complete